MIKDRYLEKAIIADLKDKMVFIGGPRQVGKTTLAKQIGKENYSDFAYYNWDNRDDRRDLLSGKRPSEARLAIYDELHKYKQWKNYIKGEFDKHQDDFDIMVTGSARLDLYRRGGDSLMGRYHYYRLHPFSVRELLAVKPAIKAGREPVFPPTDNTTSRAFADLFAFGGFPEPLFAKKTATLRRFHNERLERLVKEDIRDLESLRDLSAIQVLVELLPGRVGSLLSLNSLREDLQVTHKTISLWMEVLEKFYYHFRIYPFASNSIKSLRKEPKLYLWDWSQVADEAARLENMAASHLLKLVHYLYDTQGYKAELHYLRDQEGREVDFLVTIDKKPWLAIEVKLSSQAVENSVGYFAKRLAIPYVYQIVKESGIDFKKNGTRVMSADKFFGGLV
ncbi:MAG: ATP-binding protein [Candidatus Gracilibacteria bacterium]